MRERTIEEVLGSPESRETADLAISITVLERIMEPWYNWYYEADEGSDHEAYLQSRIKGMGDYLVACYQELERRKSEGHTPHERKNI